MRKTLLVLHMPPPFGGGEIQAAALNNYFKENKNYVIFNYSRKSLNRVTQGRFDIKNFFFGLYWILKCILLCAARKPEKIYFTLPKGFYAFLRNAVVIMAARAMKIRILGELPGTSFTFLDKEGSFKYKIGLYFLRKVDEIRFLSKSILGYHSKYGFRNNIVIKNGIEIPQSFLVNSSIQNSQTLNLVYIGSIEYAKGTFNILQALTICVKKNMDVHFHFIGGWFSEDEKEESLEYILQHELSNHITFHGFKTGNDKWILLSRCAILVHPTYWDGVPLSILEAIGLGLTVISTHVGGIPDTITEGENGFLLKDNTPEELAKVIALLYDNRSMLHEISQKNIELYKNEYHIQIFLQNMNAWFDK